MLEGASDKRLPCTTEGIVIDIYVAFNRGKIGPKRKNFLIKHFQREFIK